MKIVGGRMSTRENKKTSRQKGRMENYDMA